MNGFAIFLVFGIYTFNGMAADRAEKIDKFFSVFAANCSIVGAQTRDAKHIVDSLVDTVKSIEDDPNCRSLAGVVNELNLVGKQIQFLDQPTSGNEKTIMSLENRKRELFMMLSQNISESEARLIQTEIQSLQLQLSEYRGLQQGDFANEVYNQRVRATQSVMAATNALFSLISSSESCWVQYPSLLQNISGLGLAVGQSLALGARNPETTLVLGSGLNLISNIVDYFHRNKLDSKLEAYTNGIEATALSCALESLANQYCAAKDSEMAIQTVAQALTTSVTEDPIWSSIRLLEREVPNITEWLEMVMAGSAPSSAANARQRQDIYGKEEKLKSAFDFVQGLIAEKRKYIDSISDPKKKWVEIRALVKEITEKVYQTSYMGADQVNNPLVRRFSKDNSAFFLLGFSDPPMLSMRDGGAVIRTPIAFDMFEPFTVDHAEFRGHVLTISTQTILDSFRVWYADTLDVLMAEKSRVLIDDPLMVFAKAYPRSLNGQQKGLSPRHSLIKILEFLRSNHKTKFATPSLQIILADTITRVEDIIRRIDSVMIDKADAEAALNGISQSAKLDKGVSFLRSRIEFFVKTLIEEMILTSTEKDSKKLQLLAANDIIQYLKQYLGSQSLQKMMMDSQNAQSLTSVTMLNFMDTFKEPIDRSIQHYDQMIKQFGERGRGAHTQSKTVMCLNLATMPQSTTPVSFSRCLGLQLSSVFSNGPSSIKLDNQTMSLPFESRVCHFRDFNRRNAVFQSLLEGGNVLDSSVTATELNPTPVNLPTYEVAVVAPTCKTALAWKTENNPYCENDWWTGCDREYAQKCRPTEKRSGVGRFLGF